MDLIEECRRLTDAELIAATIRLAEESRRTTARLLSHLAVMDERTAAGISGYPSLFHYCWRKLRFSEAQAFKLVKGARISLRYREVPQLVEAGELTLGALLVAMPILLDKAVSLERGSELLARLRGKSRREAEGLVAALRPAAPRRDAVTTAASPPARDHAPAPSGEESPAAAPSPISFSYDKIEPVDGETVRLHFDVGPETAKRLERAREVLRHKFPLASFEDIINEALGLLLDKRDPEIALKLDKPDSKQTATDGRRVPAWVRRKVWRRDGGRCAYQGPDGTRCGARGGLELDHIKPFAKGGRSDDPANIQLLCRSHNRLKGLLEFPFGPSATA